MTEPVLSVRNLQVEFLTRRVILRAIDGVSFDIAKGEVLGVVGESGAGKSVTGLAVIGLIDPPGRIAGGEIRLSGRRIDHLPPEEIRRVRGKRNDYRRRGCDRFEVELPKPVKALDRPGLSRDALPATKRDWIRPKP